MSDKPEVNPQKEGAAEVSSDTSLATSRLIANVTHELKTPLHSILAVASLLDTEADGSLNAEQKRQVEMILRNGEHLLELITNLLQVSRAQTGTRPVSTQMFDAKGLFEEVLKRVRPVAKKQGVSLETDLSAAPGRFCSDRFLLHQIVSNLVSNAVKFSGKGGTVSLDVSMLGDDALSIRVADTGIGMPPEVRQAIFSDFYQAENSDDRRFEGVGLGLSIVRLSVEQLGGKIDVKSERDRGSLFDIVIPSAAAKLAEQTILVADDDSGVRLSLVEGFRRDGFSAAALGLGENLIERIAVEKPSLVILDVSADAEFSMLQKIRSSAWGKDMPIIVLSTLDAPEIRSRGLERGANDFVVKPFDISEVLARVRSQLERTT